MPDSSMTQPDAGGPAAACDVVLADGDADAVSSLDADEGAIGAENERSLPAVETAVPEQAGKAAFRTSAHAGAEISPHTGPAMQPGASASTAGLPPDARSDGKVADLAALTAAGLAGHGHPSATTGTSTASMPPPGGTPGGAGSASPAAQLTPALAVLHTTQDGAQHVTVRLNPAELAHVQVSITRAPDGAASVRVSVDRPETLHSLQVDLFHLHQALDRAGLPEQRSLSLHLNQPGLGGGAGDGSGGQAGSQAGPRHQNAQSQSLASARPEPSTLAASGPDDAAPARWLRAGLDFTA